MEQSTPRVAPPWGGACGRPWPGKHVACGTALKCHDGGDEIHFGGIMRFILVA